MRSSGRRCRRRRRMRWPLLAQRLGARSMVKHENHTPIGAFKVRGGLVYVDRSEARAAARRRPDLGDARQSRPEPCFRRPAATACR